MIIPLISQGYYAFSLLHTFITANQIYKTNKTERYYKALGKVNFKKQKKSIKKSISDYLP